MKVYSLGGYEEVGRNMTALEVKNKVLILDLGIRLDRVMIGEDTNIQNMSTKELDRLGAVPDITPLKGKEIVGIVISHGHLDHIGAISRFVGKFKCPVVGRPYPLRLLSSMLKEETTPVKCPMFEMHDSSIVIGDFEISMIPVTHSIPQSSFVIINTCEGNVVFTGDYKLDNHQELQRPISFSKLKKLDPKLLIIDSTNVIQEGITPSEKVAKTLLTDYLKMIEDSRNGIVATTFSSQIERVFTIINQAEKMGRKPVLLGKSLCKYYGLALEMGLVKKNVQMIRKREAINAYLKDVNNNKKDYLVLTTGSQGEKEAVLSRMVDDKTPYKFENRDSVIFSASVIPNPLNKASRYTLETKLKMKNTSVVRDLHVSGHASKEEHRKIIRTLSPEIVMPCHGYPDMLISMADLCYEEGYDLNDQVIVQRNGQSFQIG
ncbi:MAG TPA: MBL fold metallo-hydrolase RNA specificity domain-containing protein [Candidatus Methanofastidiosa archaeon]|nr:MBL fold metallo-hydrolase RNA specificity domain-containing protein [Candidatus Methanofastidiosa archaeon]